MNKSKLLNVLKISFFIILIVFALKFIILFVQEGFQISNYLILSFDRWYRDVLVIFFGVFMYKYLE